MAENNWDFSDLEGKLCYLHLGVTETGKVIYAWRLLST